MTTTTLVILSAAIEAVTAVALIAAPSVMAGLLLGTDLARGGIAVARMAGFGLFSLAVACWPSGDAVAAAPVRALFVYNLLVALYLAYVRVGASLSGYLLWPACVVHAVLAVLFAHRLMHGEPGSAVQAGARIR